MLKRGIEMKRGLIFWAACLIAALVPASAVIAGSSEKDEMKARHKIEEIDVTAKDTLERVFKDSETAKELFDKAHGYAVFDNLKLAFGLSGGGGSGVAVEKANGKKTYMKMGTGGIGFGIGGQKYQVVFLFEAQKPFDDFVEKGWKADASANAAAGSEGLNVQAGFVNGLAVYQITDKGLMLQADISGTKFWKDKNLNQYAGEKKVEEPKE
jgi:lipid-binding SYLF domain-containing protein